MRFGGMGMRFVRHLFLIISTLLVMLVGSASIAVTSTAMAQVAAPPVIEQDGVDCPTRHRSAQTNAFVPPALQEYYLDDWRLGPEELPRTGPIGSMLEDYKRLGGLTPSEFLGCYWNESTKGWWFPDQDGFALAGGAPVKKAVELVVGQQLDLFGSGFGRFLAPAGTAYEDRAIPPSNLDTSDVNYPFGYHLYEVTKAFTVDAGPIRAWFAQPGGGLQYMVNSRYIPGAPGRVGIPYLLENGYLRQLN